MQDEKEFHLLGTFSLNVGKGTLALGMKLLSYFCRAGCHPEYFAGANCYFAVFQCIVHDLEYAF